METTTDTVIRGHHVYKEIWTPSIGEVLQTVIRGHHVYKEIWTPSIGEVLQCEKEVENSHDLYAVAVKKQDSIVGHVPFNISTLCHLFLSRVGIITCTVSGLRKYLDDLPQDGLEVLYLLMFQGDKSSIEKVKRLNLKTN